MNPNREGPASFELPPQPPSPEGEQQQEQSVEAPAARPETSANRPQQDVPLPALPQDIPAVDQPVIAAPPQDVTNPVPVDPKAVASDADRIEREWIDKVKNVVARTQDDPFTQKDQMSKVKAEYIQKRFNKTIKTDEAAA